MALNWILGGAQLLMGGAQSIFGHNARQAAYSRAKSQARRQNDLARQQLSANYVSRVQDIMGEQQMIADAFAARVQRGHKQIQFNNEYAADVYRLRQRKLNDTFAAAAFADQARAVQAAKATGIAAAAGRTGRTAARFDVANLAQLGRNRAIQAREIMGAVDTFNMQSKMDNRKFAHQNYLVGQTAAVLPRFGRIPNMPTMPMMQDVGPAPSNMGLIMGLGQAGLSAFNTFQQFSPQGPRLNFDRGGSAMASAFT